MTESIENSELYAYIFTKQICILCKELNDFINYTEEEITVFQSDENKISYFKAKESCILLIYLY